MAGLGLVVVVVEEIEGIESAGIVKSLFKLRDATESFLNLTLSPLFNL